MLVRALETVYYGDVRRRPALYEDQDDGTTIKKKDADIFMLFERKGLDKDNNPITLTVKDQYLAIKDAVELVNVSTAEVRMVQAAKIEANRREQFDREQKEIDDMDMMVKIAKAKESGREFSVEDLLEQDKQAVDFKAQQKEIDELTEVNTDDDDDTDNPDLDKDDSKSKDGTGNKTVLS